MRAFIARILSLFTRRDNRLSDEISAHLDLLTEEYVKQGLTTIDARAAVRRAFGGVEQMKDRYRDRRGWPFVESVAQDVRFTVRAMRRSPAFAITAILTLAAGIGANAALFSVVNAVLLRPLPYRDPEALVYVDESKNSVSQSWAIGPLRERARTLSDFAGFNGPRADTLIVRDEPERVETAAVTPNFFSFLGVEFAAGRGFSTIDEGSAVAVVTHDLWTRRFERDPARSASTASRRIRSRSASAKLTCAWPWAPRGGT